MSVPVEEMPTGSLFPKGGRLESGGVAVASLLAAVHGGWIAPGPVQDDAFILFRYARNLVRGGGFAWDPGGAPIEGFTSTLHVLLLAAGLRLGVDPLLLAQLLGLVGVAFAAAAAAWLVAELMPGRRGIPTAAAFLVASVSPLAFSARGGLETPLFAALVTAAMAAWVRERRLDAGRTASSLLFFVALLSRPEAAGAAAIAVALDLVVPPGDGSRRGTTLRRWAPFALLVALLLAAKLAIFGTIVPNTFWAKEGGSRLALAAGLREAWWFAKALGPVALLLAALSAAAFLRRRTAEVLLPLGFAALLVANDVRVGGDYQYHFRYLVPAIPALAAIAAAGLAELLASPRLAGRRLARGLVAALLLVGTMAGLARTGAKALADDWIQVGHRPARLETTATYDGPYARMGRALDGIVPPSAHLAAMAVGAIGWYCDRPILDLLGLNDPEIARRPVETSRFREWMPGHMKGDAGVVLRRRPEILLLAIREDDAPGLPIPDWYLEAYPFAADLLRSEAFRNGWAPESRRLSNGKWLTFYRRRDLELPR